jgi:hypothetical protein
MDSRAKLNVSSETSFTVAMNITTIMAIQKALVYARDHSPMSSDDPIMELAEAFTQLATSISGSQEMLKSWFSLNMQDVEKPKPKAIVPPPPPFKRKDTKDNPPKSDGDTAGNTAES